MSRNKVKIDYSEMNYEGTWSNASLDSIRIDILIRQINELLPKFFDEDHSFRVAINLNALANEIVSKKPVLGRKKNIVKDSKESFQKHDLITKTMTLVKKLVRAKKTTITDYETVLKLLFECQYEKQNVLRLGLRYEIEYEEKLDELIANQK